MSLLVSDTDRIILCGVGK